MKRYADGTKVPVKRSRQELTSLLTKHGVERQAWMTGPEGDQLGFELRGRGYRLTVKRPTEVEAIGPRTVLYSNIDYIEREWMRRWRALVLLVKAKLEFAAGDDEATERELLPYLLTAGGRTLEEVVRAGALEDARGTPLLLGSGRQVA